MEPRKVSRDRSRMSMPSSRIWPRNSCRKGSSGRAATSASIAKQALKLIKVEYEVLPHVIDVVDAIAGVATGTRSGRRDVPLDTVLIKSITRVDAAGQASN